MSLKYKLIIAVVTMFVWLLKHTIRWQYIGSKDFPEAAPCVVSFWHGRLLMVPVLLKGWRGPVIISDHKDGELIAGVVGNFGVTASRGSSSKGGARALLKVLRKAKEGYSPGITPDGPRGPHQVAKAGAALMAMKSGLPILPVCFATTRFKRLSSWDNFYLPKLFCKGVVVLGAPLSALEGESLEVFSARVQQAMDDNQQQADSFFEVGAP